MLDFVREHTFILLVGDHINPLGMLRSLGEVGILSEVVLIGKRPLVVGQSRYVGSLKVFESADAGIDYIISEFSGEQNKPFILTGSDDLISAIDRNYDRLKDDFIFFNAGSQNRINAFLSKKSQNELAAAYGFNVPAFEEVSRGELPQLVGYPLITKAIDSTVGNWKSQVFVCRNEEELTAAYSQLKCDRILLQEYIEKVNETGFDALSINHGEDVYMPLQLTYHSVEKDNFGHSIYFFKPEDRELLRRINRLMKEIGFEGIFSIDFIKGKDGKLYFLEVNFRNSMWSYPMTRAGVNLPAIWAASMLTHRLEVGEVRIKRLPFSAIIETTAIKEGLREGPRGVLRSLAQIIRSDSLIVWNLRDFRPFFGYLGSRGSGG
ncbi:MAG: ATP-grasp domain-containing protein [Clostridium sp.]|nr:ATP-grasp domain-containing protein [Prevotella sp.]MCM1429697.1 ATP-grasp domain-containing protein [Clostridium sp.]MCM1474623.1 ATP-grasp domain-containing protein [Muribaculaceae bacterium]